MASDLPPQVETPFLLMKKDKLFSSLDFLQFQSNSLERARSFFDTLLLNFLNDKNMSEADIRDLDRTIGGSCGYIFQRGDVIYRCKSCTHDDTCVLCSECFQDNDHVGHAVTYSISKGSGGSCDCGEDESWIHHLSCPVHTIQVNKNDTSLEMEMGLSSFFNQALAEISPILTNNPFHFCLNFRDSPQPSDDLAVVLFNDEKHSYQDVIEILRHCGLFRPSDQATISEHFAQAIDNFGFATLAIDKEEAVRDAVKIIQSIGLQVEFFPVDFIRELTFATYCFVWLAELVEKHASFRTYLMNSFLSLNNSPLNSHMNECSLKHFFESDWFLTKSVRKSLSTILVKCGLSDPTIKHELGLIYGACFTDIFRKFLNGETREPENSIVHFSVQLFTVSSIISKLVSEFDFFTRLCSITADYLGTSSDHLSRDFVQNFAMIVSYFGYIFKDPLIKKSRFFDEPANFISFITRVCSQFNFMNPQTRQIDIHVLFESHKWTSAFTLQIYIGELILLYLDSVHQIQTCREILSIQLDSFSSYSDSFFSFHDIEVLSFSLVLKRLKKLSHEHFINTLSFIRADKVSYLMRRSTRLIWFAVDVEAGTWVRNGSSMRAQLNLFKYSPYRLIFWDGAITCLKFLLLLTPLESWLEKVNSVWPFLDSENTSAFETGRFVLSVFFSDSFTWPKDEQYITDNLVGILLSGPYSFSQLEQLVPEQCMNSDMFQVILERISDRQSFPDFRDDVFVIRPEYYDRFCPYFSAYSPEIREKAKEFMILKYATNEIDPIFNFKRSCPNAFEELKLLMNISRCQIIDDFLMNLLAANSIACLDLSLSLTYLLFGLDELKKIVETASHFPVEYLKHAKSKLRNMIELPLSVEVETDCVIGKNPISGEAKRRALERIRKSQSKVANMMSIEGEDTLLIGESLEGTCVICQEPCSIKGTSFGTLAYFRLASMSNRKIQILTGCLHKIHMKCYESLVESEILPKCPLCSSVFNFYLPIFAGLSKADLDSSFSSLTREQDLENWLGSGQFELFLRGNFHYPDIDSWSENARFGFSSFSTAFAAVNFGFPFSPVDFFVNMTLFLKDIWLYTYEFNETLQVLCCFRLAVSHWIGLKMIKVDALEFDSLKTASANWNGAKYSILHLIYQAFLSAGLSLTPNNALRFVLLGARLIAELSFGSNLINDYISKCAIGLSFWYRFNADCIFDLEYIMKIFKIDPSSFEACDPLKYPHICKTLKLLSRIVNFPSNEMKNSLSFGKHLAHRYDTLLIPSSRIECEFCKTRPFFPAQCVLCGAILCANSVCCFKNGVGECNSHIKTCGIQGGIFLLLWKNQLLILGAPELNLGLLINSPYVDQHGQTDAGLRRGRLLSISQGRLENLRKIWETCMIDTYISRHQADNSFADWRLY